MNAPAPAGIAKGLLVVGAPVAAALAALTAVAATASYRYLQAQTSPGPPSAAAVAAIPPAMLAAYRSAVGAVCPAMPWQILAAVGTVGSANGTSTLAGVHSGANPAGAEDIWTWDQGPWHVRDEGRWPRACGVSAVCEARRASGGRHTAFIACGPDGWHVSGVAGGVAE